MKKTLTISLLFSLTVLLAQTRKEIKQITKNYNVEKLISMANSFEKQASAKKEKVRKFAVKNSLPILINTNNTYKELIDVINATPIYRSITNIDAAESTRTNTLHNGGLLGLNLEGQNMTAYVWDGGIARITHQEYDGIGGTDRYSVGDSTNTLHFHAAHVTGTIMASGMQANAKGMAPQCQVKGFDWNNDLGEVTTQTLQGMLISNHSYGAIANTVPDQWFGAYNSESQNVDQILFDAPNYLMVTAAGNDGNDTTSNSSPLDNNSNYDKLTQKECAKNTMVVANAQDATIDTNGELIAVSINSSSSQGPTDDYRIKPDITGNGTQLYSTFEDADNSYSSITGTSMASPNVAGTLLLLQQYYNQINGNFMKAATLKGIALHTADDAGINGPDAVFGWGLLNAKKAAEAITQNGEESIIEELSLNNTQQYSTSVTSDGINKLSASISWTDPAGVINNGMNDHTPALINDLDIRITQNGTTYLPYKLTSINTNTKADNNVDPFERIDIDNANGNYTITVSHKGTLTNGLQNYSLVVTGLQFNGTCTADEPTNPQASLIFFGESDLIWDNVPGATYEVRYRLSNTTDPWTIITANNESITLTGLNGVYVAEVRSICAIEGTESNWVPFNNPPSFVLTTPKYIFDKFIKVYSNEEALNIESTSNYGINDVVIYNMLGKVIYKNKYSNETKIMINDSSFRNKNLVIVKITLNNGNVGFKKVLLK